MDLGHDLTVHNHSECDEDESLATGYVVRKPTGLWTRYVQGVGPVLGHGPEWLLRRCTECGHTWPEMCADAK